MLGRRDFVIHWTAPAKEQWKGILRYYKNRNGNRFYSQKIHKELIDRLQLLKKHIHLGKKVHEDKVRMLAVKDFLIFYDVHENHIAIVDVFHAAQDIQKYPSMEL